MTAAERATKLLAELDTADVQVDAYSAAAMPSCTTDELRDAIAAAIYEAVAEEREACAKAAWAARPDWHGEACGCGECTGAAKAAEAIRSRQ